MGPLGTLSGARGGIQDDLKEQIDRVLKALRPKEEKILRMRFGIGDDVPHTLEEVGQEFAVTRERIRQIEVKALGLLPGDHRRHDPYARPRLNVKN